MLLDLQDSATNKGNVYIHGFGFLFGLSQRTDTSFQVALVILLANYRSEIFHNKTQSANFLKTYLLSIDGFQNIIKMFVCKCYCWYMYISHCVKFKIQHNLQQNNKNAET